MANKSTKSKTSKKSIIVLVALIVGAGSIFYFYRNDGNINHVLQSFTVENLIKKRDDFVKIHEKYISLLKQMNADIKTLGAKLENKEEVAKALKAVGKAYEEANYLDLALENYKIALNIYPNDSYLNYKTGEILATLAVTETGENQTKFLQKAEFFYQRSLKLKPTVQKANYALGTLYLFANQNGIKVGDLDKAAQHVRDYVSKTKNLSGYFLLGNIYYSQNKKTEAISTYQTILNLADQYSPEYRQATMNIKQIEQ